MKLLKLELYKVTHRPLLNGLIITFPDPQENGDILPSVFIGTNGSGKSQVLETIAEIFLYLDRLYRPINQSIPTSIPVYFQITYYLKKENEELIVNVIQEESSKNPVFNIFNIDGEEIEVDQLKLNEFLPQKIIGYTSGANETLSLPFTDYYDEYARYTGIRSREEHKKLLPDYDPRFYLMDYNTNIGVLITNFLLGTDKLVKSLTKSIGIKGLRSFQIIIQTNHAAAPSGGVKLTKELRGWIDKLQKSATCSLYDSYEDRYILDFYMHEETKKAIKHHFSSPMEFYTALYKIELLNNLIIKDTQLKEIKKQRSQRKLIIKPPTIAEQDKVLSYSEVKLYLDSDEIINYINLSDGEHQYLNIFGTTIMTTFDNSIYLLDEPETHFNPKWRREFINRLGEIVKGRSQDFFITSHSPFIVADSKRENVYIFNRDSQNKLIIENPTEETYGSDSDFILKVAFDLHTSLSKKSYDEITKLSKSNNSSLISEKISEFGDSAEKLFLYKRLEELKKNE